MHENVPITVTQVMPASINTPLFNKSRTKLGVKPQGMPPFYQPEAVADAILYVAEHPTRDIIVGGAGKAIVLAQKLSPGLTNALLLRTGFKLQKTSELKPEDAPDNLFQPITGFDSVKGDFSKQARASYSTWLEIHPAAKWSAIATGVLTFGFLAAQVFKDAGQV